MKLKEIFKNKTIENIAGLVSSERLETIAGDVISGFQKDVTSRSARDDKLAKALKLTMQTVEKKDFPWTNAANVKYPLITNAALEFGAKLYPAIIKDGRVAEGKVYAEDEIEVHTDNPDETAKVPVPENVKQKRSDRAKNMANLLNYQCMEKMKNWERDMDSLSTMIPTLGCMFKKVYWDSSNQCPQSDLILPNDIYIQYDARSIASSPRITHKYELTGNEIKSRIRSGQFLDLNEQEIEDGDSGLTNDTMQKDLMERVADGEYHEILEQHTWLDLDEDGYKEPYVVVVLKSLQKVLSIIPRFTDEMISYKGKEISHIKPINHFVGYDFLPSQDGSIYGSGFADLLYHLNEAVNTTINQLLDAGMLSNTKGGFMAGDARMKSGSMRFVPGEIKVIQGTGGNIRDSFVQVDWGEPSGTLFQLLGTLIQAGKEVASIKDLNDLNVNAPATTTLAIIEQGLSNFKAIYKRIHRSIKEELKLILELDRIFLTEEEYKKIIPNGKIEDIKSDDCSVVPVSDPSQVSDMQRMAKIQGLFAIKDEPNVDKTKIMREYVEALGFSDAKAYVLDPQPPQQDPTLELQAGLVQAQTQKIATETRLAEHKEARETTKTMSDIAVNRLRVESDSTKKLADSIQSMALAEMKEAGSQNELYIQELATAKEALVDAPAQIKVEKEGVENGQGNPEGVVSGMEVAPDNGADVENMGSQGGELPQQIGEQVI
jgi:chaperonin GroES